MKKMKTAKILKGTVIILNYRGNEVVNFIVLEEHYARLSSDCHLHGNQNKVFVGGNYRPVSELKNFSQKQAFQMLAKYNEEQVENYRIQSEQNAEDWENFVVETDEKCPEYWGKNSNASEQWKYDVLNNNLNFFQVVEF